MKKYTLQNLDCPNCAAKLEESIRGLDFVRSVSIDFTSLSLLIDTPEIGKVQQTIDRIEPGVKIVMPDQAAGEGESFEPAKELLWIAVTALVYITGLIFQKKLENTPFHAAEYAVFLSVYLVSGWKVMITAFRNILKGKVFDENFLMMVATLGAVAIHALPEAAGVMIFFKVGEFLETWSIHRSRKSIRALLEIRPDSASLQTEHGIVPVDPETVNIGAHVVVKPGERIPLDGRVVSGNSQVDTSALTGESVPRIVREQDSVIAGMINQLGMLVIEVTRPFGESSVARILELVENAAHKKAKTELFFTSFAKYYTPVIVAISLLTALLPPLIVPGQSFADWIYRALVILVISCPCALVVSIPLTYFGAIGAASRKGILIKGSNYLDTLNSVKTIFFDKTGTVTRGVFNVTEIVTKNGYSREELLRFAAEAEAHSNHPIAVSIRKSYGKSVDPASVKEYHEIGGQGIRAVIENHSILAGNDRLMHSMGIPHEACSVPGTVVHLAVDGKYAGYLTISDELKDDSGKAIKELKAMGIKKLIMLTGDSKAIAESVCRKAGIDRFYAELMPEDKVSILESNVEHEKKNQTVAFVGDGVNDAPVLTRADVGISMGSLGSDAAIETADIVIMDDSLMKLPEALRIARKNRKILTENIVFALGIKSVFVVLGFMGIATMWEAVFGDMGVTLIAIFNAARMLKKNR